MPNRKRNSEDNAPGAPPNGEAPRLNSKDFLPKPPRRGGAQDRNQISVYVTPEFKARFEAFLAERWTAASYCRWLITRAMEENLAPTEDLEE